MKRPFSLMLFALLVVQISCSPPPVKEANEAVVATPLLAPTNTSIPPTPTAVSNLPIPQSTPILPTPTAVSDPWLMGFDASYVSRVEDRGGLYKNEAGRAADVFETLAEYGVEMIRLRVWVNPAEGYANKEDVLTLAKRAHEAGMGILIDFHNSDTWADPENQQKPADWEDLQFEALKTAVFTHTADVIDALIAQGTPPAIVQIGNETIQGMLFPAGQVGANSPLPPEQQWGQLAQLVTAGIDGVKSTGSTAQILIHIDHGGEDNGRGRWFFDNLIQQQVPFDLIGVSYYPRWHGELGLLAANIRDTAVRYQKPVLLMETSAMWTLDWADNTHNAMGLVEQQHSGFEVSSEGQYAFFRAVVETAQYAGAAGIFYWGGEWVAVDTQDEHGSAWENQALFDFDGNPLPALNVYREMAEGNKP